MFALHHQNAKKTNHQTQLGKKNYYVWPCSGEYKYSKRYQLILLILKAQCKLFPAIYIDRISPCHQRAPCEQRRCRHTMVPCILSLTLCSCLSVLITDTFSITGPLPQVKHYTTVETAFFGTAVFTESRRLVGNSSSDKGHGLSAFERSFATFTSWLTAKNKILKYNTDTSLSWTVKVFWTLVCTLMHDFQG